MFALGRTGVYSPVEALGLQMDERLQTRFDSGTRIEVIAHGVADKVE